MYFCSEDMCNSDLSDAKLGENGIDQSTTSSWLTTNDGTS